MIYSFWAIRVSFPVGLRSAICVQYVGALLLPHFNGCMHSCFSTLACLLCHVQLLHAATCDHLKSMEVTWGAFMQRQSMSDMVGFIACCALFTARCLQEILASAEVILSAGPYHSAKILQLSGIGPAAVLQNFSITPVTVLPVGESAQVRVFMAACIL
jgi:hypothetical protein